MNKISIIIDINKLFKKVCIFDGKISNQILYGTTHNIHMIFFIK